MKILISATLLSIFLLIPAASINGATPTIDSQVTTEVVNGQPVDNITHVDTSYEKVFYYTYIEGCTGCTLVHEWFQGDQLIHHYETSVRASRMRWWTQKPSVEPGLWVVRTIVNGRVVQSHAFEHTVATMKQQQMAPLQSRIQKRIVDECDETLQQFTRMAEEHPEDPYYQFMVKKWTARCGRH